MTSESVSSQPQAEANHVSTGATSSSSSHSSSSSSKGVTASTTVATMQQLKEKAPKVYKAMMLGIATNICNGMKKSQDRIHQLNVQARADARQT